MGRSAWEPLEDLYLRAQRGDKQAWFALEVQAVAFLETWLGKHHEALLPWEAEAIAVEAFETAMLKSGSILAWSQAWTYARKTGRSLANRRLRKSGGATTWSAISLRWSIPARRSFGLRRS